jgi:hypothetical protein
MRLNRRVISLNSPSLEHGHPRSPMKPKPLMQSNATNGSKTGSRERALFLIGLPLLFAVLAISELPPPSVSMGRFGGVGGLFVYPCVQVRERPVPRFFSFRQTLMPEFDQPPFYIDRTKPNR